MKIRSFGIIPGVIITILGIVFHFQGKGVVGPESSFMYSNPEWINYGIILIIIGLVITVIGISIRVTKKL
jgi:uncharacterized membrane protein